MPELSDLLRQRLAIGKPVDAHPDPDTLTAFAERLLSLREQNRVLEHLALCGPCREVIALSQAALPSHPDVEAVSLPMQAKRAPRRLWAPLFGLAASVAAVGLVAVLTIRGPHTGTPAPLEQAKLVPAATPAASIATPAVPPVGDGRPAGSRLAATVASPEKPSRTRPAEVNADSVVRMIEHEAAPAPPVVVAGNASAVNAITASVGRRDYLNESAMRRGDTLTALNQNGTTLADLPTAPGTRIDPSQLAYGFANNNKQLSNSELPVLAPGSTKVMALWTPPNSSARHGLPLIANAITREAARIVFPARRGTLAIGAPGFNAMSGQSFNPARDKGQSFEITAAGALGTSDLGQTQAFTPRAMRARTGSASDTRTQTQWAVGDGKLLRTNETGAWVSGYSGTDSVDFSAVTSQGAEVWAGGRNTALLHSHDGGVTWERVRLGENAAGTVKNISATGSNIQVTTSENQSWFSEDGGRTWTLNQ